MHARGTDLRQHALAGAATAIAGACLAAPAAATAPAAAATCATSIALLISARRRVGSTVAAIRIRLLDPFVMLAIAAVLAGAHAVLAAFQPVRSVSAAAPAVLLATGAITCLGIVALLRERLRHSAMELAREAAFVSAIGAVTLWLAWMEEAWESGQISALHAVLALGALAATVTAFILAGRFAVALGSAARWFVAPAGALVLSGLFQVIGSTNTAGPWERAASAASLAAAGLFSAGAAHRGLVGLRTMVGVPPTRVGAARLAVVLAAVLLVPTVSIGRLVAGVEVSIPSLAGATTVLSLGAVAYLAGLARDWGRLERRAQHDELTGLPNRRYFIERLTQAVADAGSKHQRPTVLFCDLDRFKVVNDSLGHAAGNQLLIAIAGRLTGSLPDDALAARLGGDEFAVLLPDGDVEDALAVARSVRGQLVLPVHIHGRRLHVDTSIGIARFPDDGADPDTLMRAADTAMYSAKDLGRGRVVVHSSGLRDEMESRFALETDLHRALDLGQLHLVYQPRVDLTTGSIVGAEALLRWQHPHLGAISPSRFIPVAEETGLISRIGVYALREACRQLAAWEAAGFSRLVVSVNLSARQFELDRVSDIVARVLRETGADPTWLELELTESLAHHDVDEVSTTLADLAEMGVRCSMDDFGTGYSGLSYLGRFPLHALKIDRAFVQAIDASRPPGSIGDPTAVVGAVIALGRSFGLRVIAEGVETQEQLRFMLEHGCDELQGHLFSPPVDAESFGALVVLERSSSPGRLDALKSALAEAERDRRRMAADANVIHLGGRRLGRIR